MAGNNNFQALKQHATKIHKFTQAKSIALLNPQGVVYGNAINAVTFSQQQFDAIKGGVCAALTCAWLQEKQGSGQAFASKPDSRASTVHAGRNLASVINAAPQQIQYAQLQQGFDLFVQYGLKESLKISDDQVIKMKKVPHTERWASGYTKKTMIVEIDILPSIVNACEPAYLKQGRGVYMSFTIVGTAPGKSGGGHAVGAYRSRGNTLYFFDSNCGVYQINDLNGFVAAWMQGYANLNYNVTINQGKGDGFRYVDR